MLKTMIVLLLVLSTHLAVAQSGCTDPNATNYNSSATLNDASCTYASTLQPITHVANLSATLNEISGLIWLPGSGLWGLNDGGSPAAIYKLDTASGTILQTVYIKGVINQDWEDMATDSTYLYIGDFGNNSGTRTNLRIYKVRLTDILLTPNDTVNAIGSIRFNYPEQTSFVSAPQNHDFDCEAMFCHNGQLHLFTKQWVGKKTWHYTLPSDTGIYSAILRDTLNAMGYVTGADIQQNGHAILTTNTSSGNTEFWLLYDHNGTNYFSGNKRRIETGTALVVGQLESVAWNRRYGAFFASEAFLGFTGPMLGKLGTHQWTGYLADLPSSIEAVEALQPLFKNPVQDVLQLVWNSPTIRQYALYDINGQLLAEGQSQNSMIEVDMSALPDQLYIFQLDGQLFKVLKLSQ